MSAVPAVREIRSPDDLGAVSALLSRMGLSRYDKDIRDTLEGDDSAIFSLSVGDDVVAAITVMNGELLSGGKDLEGVTAFSHLIVSPEHRRKGYGLMLLEVMEDYAKDVHESYGVACSLSERNSVSDEILVPGLTYINVIDLYGFSDTGDMLFAAIEEFAPDEYILDDNGCVKNEEFQYRKRVRISAAQQRRRTLRRDIHRSQFDLCGND